MMNNCQTHTNELSINQIPGKYRPPHRASLLAALAALALLLPAVTVAGGETELITPETPWRVWLVLAPEVARDAKAGLVVEVPGHNPARFGPYTAEAAHLSELPPASWNARDCDDRLVGRYAADLYETMGGYGCRIDATGWRGTFPATLYLRTLFGVSEPAKATDVKVPVEYLGGAVVYVNGIEVGRSHLPEGKIEPHTLATDYPIETYPVEDGTTPLPPVGLGAKPDAKWLPRYQGRVRTMTALVPAQLLALGGTDWREARPPQRPDPRSGNR